MRKRKSRYRPVFYRQRKPEASLAVGMRKLHQQLRIAGKKGLAMQAQSKKNGGW
jgi:hypothetical protein